MSAVQLDDLGVAPVMLRKDLSACLDSNSERLKRHARFDSVKSDMNVTFPDLIIGDLIDKNRQTRTHTPTPGAGFALVLNRLSASCPQNECWLIKRLEHALDVSKRPVCVPEVTA